MTKGEQAKGERGTKPGNGTSGGGRGGNREVVRKEISVRIIVACGHDNSAVVRPEQNDTRGRLVPSRFDTVLVRGKHQDIHGSNGEFKSCSDVYIHLTVKFPRSPDCATTCGFPIAK